MREKKEEEKGGAREKEGEGRERGRESQPSSSRKGECTRKTHEEERGRVCVGRGGETKVHLPADVFGSSVSVYQLGDFH